MDKVYINGKSLELIRSTQKSKPHAVILSGRVGVGLNTIATKYLASNSECINLNRAGDTISVDDIRGIYDLTRTRHDKGRVIILDNAEKMSIPAQNAFLKLLEEPSASNQFILLTHSVGSLLDTIRSRVQLIDIKPIDAKQTNLMIDNLNVSDPKIRQQLIFLAEGLPAELTRLIEDKDYFNSKVELITDARLFLTSNPYVRLKLALKYKDSRENAQQLILSALKLLQLSLISGKSDDSIHSITKLEEVYVKLENQGNVRLQLSSVLAL